MNFRASFCDPFKPDIIELGEIEKEKIIEYFEKVPWGLLLDKVKTANEGEIHYSPSLEVENKKNKNGLAISAIDGTEWYIFFKRPKMVKKWFGLIEKMEDNYVTDITGQTIEDVHNCLNALINNELEYLENHIK